VRPLLGRAETGLMIGFFPPGRFAAHEPAAELEARVGEPALHPAARLDKQGPAMGVTGETIVPMRPIPTRAADTDVEAERVQLELLRNATPGERAALAMSMSATVISLTHRALQTQDPDASDEEIKLRFVELNYGRELAAELVAFLNARPR